MLIVGYSGFEGVGSALMIPPIYILATLAFSDLQSRAKAFGVISGMGGIGAAAGPLIGGLITTTISWRASFLLQAAVVATIIYLSLKITDPLPADPTRPFDGLGAVLSAAGMSFLVIGILQAGNNNTLLVLFLALGAAFLLWFFLHIRSSERAGKEPLLSTGLFRNRTSNLGLVTQNIQWLLLMGITFVVSVFLQTEHGFSAIKTGVIFTAATAGILMSSLSAERLAKKYAQTDPDPRWLHRHDRRRRAAAARASSKQSSEHVLAFTPGLLVIGLGLGVMLTPRSTSCSQASLNRNRARSQASRAASPTSAHRSAPRSPARSSSSDLAASNKNQSYILAMVSLAALALIGLAAADLPPRQPRAATEHTAPTPPPQTARRGRRARIEDHVSLRARLRERSLPGGCPSAVRNC